MFAGHYLRKKKLMFCVDLFFVSLALPTDSKSFCIEIRFLSSTFGHTISCMKHSLKWGEAVTYTSMVKSNDLYGKGGVERAKDMIH